MQTLLYKDFRKFTKIYMFLKIKTDIAHMDNEIKQLELETMKLGDDSQESGENKSVAFGKQKNKTKE